MSFYVYKYVSVQAKCFYLVKNKVLLKARGGDIASIDVVVPPKNTGIAPGPMLTEFKENKIPTKIDQGTIWILKENNSCKKRVSQYQLN